MRYSSQSLSRAAGMNSVGEIASRLMGQGKETEGSVKAGAL